MVEALTIVLAAGVARSWRSALEGAATAIVALSAVVAIVGVPLIRYVPLAALRLLVGVLLLVLGASWLRKAVLRASGLKALHDEDAIFAAVTTELGDSPTPARRDKLAFVVAFKGVFVEGTEVVLIVISLGATQHRLGLAAGAAGVALLVVTLVGAIVARQLSSVPENAIKLGVGVVLTSFGVFWIGEGAGVGWPGADLFVLCLIGLVGGLTSASIWWLRAHQPQPG